ncbi:hypothetical protein B0H12DRAFT_1139701 [Mycena haematopus]|nr:hypothetical protein B0H12DRAFT_1139701 [Mycena haematopus]
MLAVLQNKLDCFLFAFPTLRMQWRFGACRIGSLTFPGHGGLLLSSEARPMQLWCLWPPLCNPLWLTLRCLFAMYLPFALCMLLGYNTVCRQVSRLVPSGPCSDDTGSQVRIRCFASI